MLDCTSVTDKQDPGCFCPLYISTSCEYRSEIQAGERTLQSQALMSPGYRGWRRNPTNECRGSDPELDLSVLTEGQRHFRDFCHQNIFSYVPLVFWEGKMLRDVQAYGEFIWMYFKEIGHAVSQQTRNPKQPDALQNSPLNFVETMPSPTLFFSYCLFCCL